ncbi:GNAT family N-acetyltransferase [Phaeovulum sp.]|uniref:GNAT family N-acetyltransferase n=1 Tax=Phaeovulum sp. TaxID=2934796 RepID=UPI0039E2D2C1
MGEPVEITLLSGFSEISAKEWDACACPEAATGRAVDPFTTYRFLLALERSGSVGADSGWVSRPLVAHRAGQMIAAAPLYVKQHSQGEYIFDHGWADAYERAGGRYYPKLQCAVPFTPVTGRRLLTLPGHEAEGRAALLEAIRKITEESGLSSAHITFCTKDESDAAARMGFLPRVTQQYHWHNRGYATFDEFLATLTSRKRKALRRERAQAQGFGGTIHALTGDQITPAHWDAFWAFYQDTGARKWGHPYLTRAFFDALHDMRDDVLLVLAKRGDTPVAGALNLIGRETLFGRYWGCLEDHPHLHFELCYHQAIDWAIAHGLSRVEAGAQGEHKLARGYLPVAIHSAHWLRDPAFQRAVAGYLENERAAVGAEITALTRYGPYHHTPEAET